MISLNDNVEVAGNRGIMDTREKIMAAAIRLFASKGRYGTKMEEVGAQADVNKAMVYYYYSSKENLYFEVLKTILREQQEHAHGNFSVVQEPLPDYIELIKKVIRIMYTRFQKDPDGSKIMLDAMINMPDMMFNAIQTVSKEQDNTRKSDQMKLYDMITEGIASGTFRNIDPGHTFISIIGLATIYHLVGKPIAQNFLNLKIEDEQAFLREREDAILDLVLYGIVGRENSPKKE